MSSLFVNGVKYPVLGQVSWGPGGARIPAFIEALVDIGTGDAADLDVTKATVRLEVPTGAVAGHDMFQVAKLTTDSSSVFVCFQGRDVAKEPEP